MSHNRTRGIDRAIGTEIIFGLGDRAAVAVLQDPLRRRRNTVAEEILIRIDRREPGSLIPDEFRAGLIAGIVIQNGPLVKVGIGRPYQIAELVVVEGRRCAGSGSRVRLVDCLHVAKFIVAEAARVAVGIERASELSLEESVGRCVAVDVNLANRIASPEVVRGDRDVTAGIGFARSLTVLVVSVAGDKIITCPSIDLGLRVDLADDSGHAGGKPAIRIVIGRQCDLTRLVDFSDWVAVVIKCDFGRPRGRIAGDRQFVEVVVEVGGIARRVGKTFQTSRIGIVVGLQRRNAQWIDNCGEEIGVFVRLAIER